MKEALMRETLDHLEQHDIVTTSHSRNVAEILREFLSYMGAPLKECGLYYLGGLLHDIGKTQIPLEILRKPGALTEEEFETIKSHPQLGYDLMKDVISDEIVFNIILYHHKKLNGGGYPATNVDVLPKEARIAAIVDIYEALTSNERPYKKAWSTEDVIKLLRNDKGLDQYYVEKFVLFLSQDLQQKEG